MIRKFSSFHLSQKNRSSEIKLKRGLELKKAMDNASLLNEMLNNFKSNETTDDELVTIKELYTSCQNLIPTISRLAGDIQNNELLGKYFHLLFMLLIGSFDCYIIRRRGT